MSAHRTTWRAPILDEPVNQKRKIALVVIVSIEPDATAAPLCSAPSTQRVDQTRLGELRQPSAESAAAAIRPVRRDALERRHAYILYDVLDIHVTAQSPRQAPCDIVAKQIVMKVEQHHERRFVAARGTLDQVRFARSLVHVVNRESRHF